MIGFGKNVLYKLFFNCIQFHSIIKNKNTFLRKLCSTLTDMISSWNWTYSFVIWYKHKSNMDGISKQYKFIPCPLLIKSSVLIMKLPQIIIRHLLITKHYNTELLTVFLKLYEYFDHKKIKTNKNIRQINLNNFLTIVESI